MERDRIVAGLSFQTSQETEYLYEVRLAGGIGSYDDIEAAQVEVELFETLEIGHSYVGYGHTGTQSVDD